MLDLLDLMPNLKFQVGPHQLKIGPDFKLYLDVYIKPSKCVEHEVS